MVYTKKTRNERGAGRKPIVQGGMKKKLISIDKGKMKILDEKVKELKSYDPCYNASQYIRDMILISTKIDLTPALKKIIKLREEKNKLPKF